MELNAPALYVSGYPVTVSPPASNVTANSRVMAILPPVTTLSESDQEAAPGAEGPEVEASPAAKGKAKAKAKANPKVKSKSKAKARPKAKAKTSPKSKAKSKAKSKQKASPGPGADHEEGHSEAELTKPVKSKSALAKRPAAAAKSAPASGSGQAKKSAKLSDKNNGDEKTDDKNVPKLSGIYSYKKQNRFCFKMNGREVCLPQIGGVRLDPVKMREAIELVLGHAGKGDSFEFCRELAASLKAQIPEVAEEGSVPPAEPPAAAATSAAAADGRERCADDDDQCEVSEEEAKEHDPEMDAPDARDVE